MMRWQKRARIVIAIVAVVFAVIVAFAFKRRAAPSDAVLVVRTDPNAVVESTAGRVMRFNRAHEEVSLQYERQLTYANGSTKLIGVKVVTDNRAGGRSFTVSGREGQVGEKESSYTLNGDVKLVASDGFTAKTEHATYTANDGFVRAPGAVEFAHDRLTGSGNGMTYDKNADVLTILDQAVVRIAAGGKGGGAADVASGVAIFSRGDHTVRFDRGMKIQRAGQMLDADTGVAHLTSDEQRIDTLELHGNAKIAGSNASAGGLQALTGRDVTLKYAPDGDALQHAAVSGESVIQLAGDSGRADRPIAQPAAGNAVASPCQRETPTICANAIDISLAPDGSTPTSLTARDAVQLTLPAGQGAGARTIRAASLDATGEPGRGLRKAQFTGDVEYKETGADGDRVAKSARLDVGLKPGLSAIDEATFTGNARFADPKMFGTAASVHYLVDSGALELTGTEPTVPVPHVFNDQIAVDATRIDVSLAGPALNATANVKSVLQPPKKSAQKSDTKLPSMLKQDQAVNVTANALEYDGKISKATYRGASQLWQAETSIKAESIVIDDKKGDVNASGSVVTAALLQDKDKKKERVRSTGTANDFEYQESIRRAIYTGDAHLSGPQGDMTAAKIELYLKPSGDELDRVEAYDGLTLREQNRKTTGSRLTYTAADEVYLVTGAPMTVVDECGRETTGQRLTFHKGADTIDVDGSRRIRTQTKGGDKCQ